LGLWETSNPSAEEFVPSQLFQALIAIVRISPIAFTSLHLTGHPVLLMVHRDALREVVEELRAHLGADRSVWERLPTTLLLTVVALLLAGGVVAMLGPGGRKVILTLALMCRPADARLHDPYGPMTAMKGKLRAQAKAPQKLTGALNKGTICNTTPDPTQRQQLATTAAPHLTSPSAWVNLYQDDERFGFNKRVRNVIRGPADGRLMAQALAGRLFR
jgi:hypothetical protein